MTLKEKTQPNAGTDVQMARAYDSHEKLGLGKIGKIFKYQAPAQLKGLLFY